MPSGTAFDAAALTRMPRVGELAVAPDGSWLAVVVQRLDQAEARYVSDLWRVPVAGGTAVRLTRGPSKDATPRFRSDGALGFLSNRNPRDGEAAAGDEDRMQVWLLPECGGEPMAITDEPLGVTDFGFGGERLIVLAEVLDGTALDQMRGRAQDIAENGPSVLHYRESPVRHWDIWLPATSLHAIALDARGRTDLTPTARHQLRNGPGDPGLTVSADGAQIAVAMSELGADRVPDGWIRLIDVASGVGRDLGRAAGVWHNGPRFSRDGRLAAERHTRRRGAGDVQRLVIFEKDVPRVIAPDWDASPSLHGWTDDGALLASVHDAGTQPAYRVALDGEIARLTPAAAGGSYEHLFDVPGRAAFVGVRHALLQPPEPFVCEGGGTPRLLACLSGFTAEHGAALATWESRWTPGDGGTPVQWFLMRPAINRDTAPLLLWIHGGPVHHYADAWSWRWNPLVAAAAGYAVAMPNPRGSTGRGQAFVDGVYGNTWGAACYRDLLACLDEAITVPGIDGSRVAAMGGSFGGYMVNWIGTQTDRFRCLVSHAGLFNLGASYGSSDYPGYMRIEFGDHPFREDPSAYRRYSPDALAMQWKTPVLFTHGEKDYRVPITEALIAFEAVKTAGADAELLVFPDENHWIMRPRNIRAWYQAWLDFVARHMG
jgi:dipeptidyl aminopeptidase/acylaminoacyl peptidase